MRYLFNVLFIGLGPHARHHHFKIIQMMEDFFQIRCCAIVDLFSQKDLIQEYLKVQGKTDVPVLHIDDREKDCRELTFSTQRTLSLLVDKYKINKVIISTEPKAHFAYIQWAIDEGLDFLVDKPIFSETYENVLKNGKSELYNYFLEASHGICQKEINASVMMPRRLHPAILRIYDYLKNFVRHYKVPITHINFYHGEGMWNMPNEFFTRENHPYKYGYGAYFHTGYHFIDLLMYILKINMDVEKGNYDRIEFALTTTRPVDVCTMFGKDAYYKLIGFSDTNDFFVKLENMGEIDWQLLINFCIKDVVYATGNLDMQQTNYSARKSKELPADVYKNNGRVYHEIISIDVAHLLSIKMMRMTIGDQRNKEKYRNKEEDFVIHIYRNQNLVGGKAFEEIVIPYQSQVYINNRRIEMNLGDVARYNVIFDWLFNSSERTSFATHNKSMRLFAEIQTLLAQMHVCNKTIGCSTVSLQNK